MSNTDYPVYYQMQINEKRIEIASCFIPIVKIFMRPEIDLVFPVKYKNLMIYVNLCFQDITNREKELDYNELDIFLDVLSKLLSRTDIIYEEVEVTINGTTEKIRVNKLINKILILLIDYNVLISRRDEHLEKSIDNQFKAIALQQSQFKKTDN